MNVPLPVTTAEGLVASGGVASATLLNANPGRDYLLIQNTHATQDLFVRFGAVAATTAIGLKIAAGTSKEWPSQGGIVVPADAVQVIGSGAGTTLYCVEGTGRRMA